MNCKIIGRPSDWDGLDESKSLFKSNAGCGLPIGNLTSQLFSNVYLGVLDHYMKRSLRCRHYGRYVDDFYVVSSDKHFLHETIVRVRDFLTKVLGLELHGGKIMIDSAKYGLQFLGAFLKPWRKYISNETLHRMLPKLKKALAVLGCSDKKTQKEIRHACSSLTSICGVLSHYSVANLRPYCARHYWLLPVKKATAGVSSRRRKDINFNTFLAY